MDLVIVAKTISQSSVSLEEHCWVQERNSHDIIWMSLV